MIIMIDSEGGLERSFQCMLSIWYSETLPARERDDIGNFKGDLVAKSLKSEKKSGHRRKEKSDGSQCFDAISPVLVKLKPASNSYKVPRISNLKRCIRYTIFR